MTYSIPDLKILTADADAAPREMQLARVRRAERLAGRLDPDAAYAAEDLRRSLDGAADEIPAAAEADGEATFRGEDALRDLRLFAEDLSASVGLAAEEVGEPVLTVDEIARKLGVSGKTVDRWRDRGLVSRKLKLDGRRRVGFLQSTVDRFVRDHADEVERGRKTVSLSDADRGRIVRKARSLANGGFSPPQIAQQLSDEFGRSPESIRTLLREFEREHPDRPVFRVRPGDLTRAEKEEILRRRRRGVTLARLAKAFGRTKPIIKRALHELRAEEVMGDPPAYMDSPEFHTPRRRRGRAVRAARQGRPRTAACGCPAACRPTWPASTTTRCSPARTSSTGSAR